MHTRQRPPAEPRGRNNLSVYSGCSLRLIHHIPRMSVLRTPGDLMLDNGRQINIGLAEPQLQQNPFRVQCDRLETKSSDVKQPTAGMSLFVHAYTLMKEMRKV